jgi:hypothetical protein
LSAHRAFFIVGLVAASAVVPFVADADDGLTLILFVTPPDAGLSETISIDIECYWWGQPVDVDEVRLTMSPYGASPTFSNVSAGKYHASYTLLRGDVDGGTITMQASAVYRGTRATDISYYAPRGGHYATGWRVQLRQVSPQNLAPPPGSHVVLEARSYDGYLLKDGGAVNATLRETGPSGPLPDEILPPTRVSDGVYRFAFDIPANLSASRAYEVQARLGVANYGANAYVRIWSNPIPVTVYLLRGNGSAATLRVIAGTDAPVAGAQVELREDVSNYDYPPRSADVFRNSTNASGVAEVVATHNASGDSYASYRLNVTRANRTTSVPVFLSFDTLTAWRPLPPYNYSCELRLQTDTASIRPGDLAQLAFRVTYDGAPEVRRQVPRFAWRAWVAGTIAAGNITTDANGVFSLNYSVPANWSSSDWLFVQVDCPEGRSARETVYLGFGSPYAGRNLVLNASGFLGRNITVNVTYTGPRPLAGASALALLIPGTSVTGLVTSMPPDALYVPLTLHGSTFSGTAAVPAWLPAGDYIVVVQVSNQAATDDASEQVVSAGFAALSLFPAPPDPPAPPNPTPSENNPGDASAQSSSVSLLLGSISLAIGAAWFMSKRRRRIADSRAERAARMPPGRP